MISYRTKDHPEANGRTAQIGDEAFTYAFPLEDGSTLYVETGRDGMLALRQVVLDQMIDENIEKNAIKKVKSVLVSGHFDPMHSGHLCMIEAAKELGEKLIVIVNTDLQIRLKGNVPLLDENERLLLASRLKAVDMALLAIDEDRTINKTLEYVRPAIYANGGDVTIENCREHDTCERLGIKMVFGVGGSDKANSSRDIKQNYVEKYLELKRGR